jgi:hypothetical protein
LTVGTRRACAVDGHWKNGPSRAGRGFTPQYAGRDAWRRKPLAEDTGVRSA